MGEPKLHRLTSLADAVLGCFGFLLTVAGAYVATVAFFLQFTEPCGLSEGECSASTSTRIEAVGTVPFAVVALVSLFLASVRLVRAGSQGSPAPLAGFGRNLLLAVAGAALWVGWLAAYPSTATDTPANLVGREEPPAPAPGARCDEIVSRPAPGRIFLGKVGFVGYGTERSPLGSEIPSSRRRAFYDGDRFARLPIQVRTGEEVIVQVPFENYEEPSISGWGRREDAYSDSQVIVDERLTSTCRGEGWIVYGGGITFGPLSRCVHLRIEVGGRHAYVPIGLGRGCEPDEMRSRDRERDRSPG